MHTDVLVITRARRQHLVATLEAVLPQLSDGDRCYVLENGCPERSTEGLDDRFPDVRFSRVEENLGVAAGRNAVAALGDAPLLLFLDDDGVPMEGLLDGVRERFVGDPELTLLALRIEDPSTGRPRPHEFPARDKSLADRAFAPTYFVGAGFALRRTAFEAVGGFDEWLFYALEELDLSYRLLRAGGRFAYDPRLRVAHHAAAAGRPSGQFFRHSMRSRWRVPLRHLPLRYALVNVLGWTVVLGLRAVRQGRIRDWAAGLREGIAGVSATWRSRDPLPPAVLAALRASGGRLWW